MSNALPRICTDLFEDLQPLKLSSPVPDKRVEKQSRTGQEGNVAVTIRDVRPICPGDIARHYNRIASSRLKLI